MSSLHSLLSTSLHDVVPVVGWSAAVLVLTAYGLMTAGRLRSDGAAYLVANAIGAAGLAVSSITAHNWQSAAVNVLWLGLGAAPLLRALRAHRAAPEQSATATGPAPTAGPRAVAADEYTHATAA